ncbi:uncharacterized protein LOC110828390 isoform X2 [Zootermopsis nevadensis]|uniref:uncharacterized protein LOC110828390 isoform X2 n=1 Tax=Zootermopsis nevadensis TaxID=136037 RepID=UPI000B8E6944|nr:uncharacterized protein LOC110828390 isoform X2 [Zootermopsis nevadensis]
MQRITTKIKPLKYFSGCMQRWMRWILDHSHGWRRNGRKRSWRISLYQEKKRRKNQSPTATDAFLRAKAWISSERSPVQVMSIRNASCDSVTPRRCDHKARRMMGSYVVA